MEFKRYNSIENHYQAKFLAMFLHMYPELKDEVFEISEKIHGCFQAKTRIAMADGSYKTIKEIVDNKITDKVLGVDGLGKIVETSIINHYNNGKTKDWLKVTINRSGLDKGGNNAIIRCTPNHKFYNPISKKYSHISEFNEGDKVIVKRIQLNLTFLQKEILKGIMLGDGSYSNRSIAFNHKRDHEEYIDYTLKLLGNVAGNKQKDGISGYGTEMCRARSISNYSIEDLFKNWFHTKIKQVPEDISLSPISLAFWYMDDGSLSHHIDQEDRASFATNGFNEKSIDNLLNALKKLGIDGVKYQSKGWRIRLNRDSADILFTLIAPYIPNCMKYKIPKRFHDVATYSISDVAVFLPHYKERVIVKIEKDLEKETTKYDIETGTHNYFASDVLVHNCNIQIKIAADEYRVGKRSCFLPKEHPECFDNLQIYVEDNLKEIIESIQRSIKADIDPDSSVTLYGEYFGKGIQKGVDYGKEKRIRFFNMRRNGILQPQDLFTFFMNTFGLKMVPVVAIIKGLENALAYETEFKSKVFPEAEGENICEGIVIKPLNKVYRTPQGSIFYIKKKNAKFLERSRQPKPKELKDLGEIGKLQEIFKTYINKNRVDNVMSKHGEITDIKQVGEYVRLVLEDAKEDFHKDNDLEEIPKKDHRAIYNVGSMVFNLVKEYL